VNRGEGPLFCIFPAVSGHIRCLQEFNGLYAIYCDVVLPAEKRKRIY